MTPPLPALFIPTEADWNWGRGLALYIDTRSWMVWSGCIRTRDRLQQIFLAQGEVGRLFRKLFLAHDDPKLIFWI